MGWLGCLDWLYRYNKVFGTELAGKEDEDDWLSHRVGAPPDADIDPWGHQQIKRHLQFSWQAEPRLSLVCVGFDRSFVTFVNFAMLCTAPECKRY